MDAEKLALSCGGKQSVRFDRSKRSGSERLPRTIRHISVVIPSKRVGGKSVKGVNSLAGHSADVV